MKDLFLELYQNPSFFALLIFVAAVAFYAAWQASKHLTKCEMRHSNIDGKISAIGEDVKMLVEKIVGNALLQAKSPITLSDKGKLVAEEIEAEKIFAAHSNELIKKVEEEMPANALAYDIQEAAFKVAQSELPKLITKKEMAIIKDSAFNRGDNILMMWPIFGVILRDKILKDKGIELSETDKQSQAP
jgi:phosphopantetheinyl transferase (holo-ACP synthase)